MNARRFTLDDPPFGGLTGKGVRVAVVDSGVHQANPHIGVPVTGVRIGGDGAIDGDFVDRIGHGTAVAAAILDKAPDVELVAVRVFDRTLSTTGEVLARAIGWSAANGARLINLSLGTANSARTELLGAVVDEAMAAGAIVVSASESGGTVWLPGALPNAVGVVVDASGDRHVLAVELDDRTRTRRYAASGYPRPIPGVPLERNLSGISFAVANVTGFLARLLSGDRDIRDADAIAQRLGPLTPSSGVV